MSEWSRNADWERFLRETIKLGDLPSTQFAKDCGIPFGAWLEMANKANRIGKTSTIKWATESLEKITKKEASQETSSDEKDQELAERYTIITNLGWSASAYYIVNADESNEILRWGEKALTFTSKKEAERFASEVFSGKRDLYNIENIENWENEGGHLLADNLTIQDGHLKERKENKILYAKNIDWDTDGESPCELGLPDRILIPPEVATEGDEKISDYITQETGFCHKGFELEESLPKKRKPKTR